MLSTRAACISSKMVDVKFFPSTLVLVNIERYVVVLLPYRLYYSHSLILLIKNIALSNEALLSGHGAQAVNYRNEKIR